MDRSDDLMTQSLNYSIPRVVIAGLKGGSGKTILSLGLIASYRQKGLNIIPFKKGPDYIDAGWLACAAGFPCYNLDAFLIGKDRILSSFVEHFCETPLPPPPLPQGEGESLKIPSPSRGEGKGGDEFHCAFIEGNRGLFDGMDSEGRYSTAELAKILNAPIILTIDCTKMTRTAAIIAAGIHKFDPALKISGIVLNQIANKRHEKVIRESFEKYCQVPVLGAIPRLSEEFFPERHMGLTPYHEHKEVENAISAIAEIAQRYLNLDAIWKIANEAPPLEVQSSKFKVQSYKNSSLLTPHSSLRIGVIKDSAFQFYYPENLEELQKRGVTLIEISALKEKQIPEIDALYIGGGFPETHAIALAENIDFRNNLRKVVENGLPAYAECGGLMYLGESLVLDDRTYPMTGVFPVKFCLEKKPQAHGYTIVEVNKPNPYYSVGTLLRGHEFHYSRVLNTNVAADILSLSKDIYFAFKMNRGQGIVDKMDGICYKNVLATYTHLHALGAGEWVDGIINMAGSYKRYRKSKELI
ncbi:MAG: cobyrinate a,c-diamide synthase [Nitrospirota bacterium]